MNTNPDPNQNATPAPGAESSAAAPAQSATPAPTASKVPLIVHDGWSNGHSAAATASDAATTNPASSKPPFASASTTAPGGAARYRLAPMPGPVNLSSVLESLLRFPGSVVCQANGERPLRLFVFLLATALGGFLVFGLLLGSFSGGEQTWQAPLKISLGAFGSALICLPSLYIFGCLAGVACTLRQIFSLLLASLALAAVLLIGFGPVIWIFAQSSSSLVFMGMLGLALWAIALWFGLNLVLHIARNLGLRSKAHLLLWAGIFAMVTCQMTSSLRPILGPAETFLPGEKKFFLDHWMEQAGMAPPANGAGQWSVRSGR
jgi:hypothetical protein